MERDVTISLAEYRKLIAISERVDVFSKFVKKEKYCVQRDACASILGFDLSDEEEERGNV